VFVCTKQNVEYGFVVRWCRAILHTAPNPTSWFVSFAPAELRGWKAVTALYFLPVNFLAFGKKKMFSINPLNVVKLLLKEYEGFQASFPNGS